MNTKLVLLLLAAASVSLVAGRSDVLESANQLTSNPFKVCIDDSDCLNLEGKYACFQYICYPYADDTTISPQYRKTRCTRKEECNTNEMCYRHHDRRNINRGLCMEELGNCQEKGERDCPNKCCNGQFCCHEEYFNQLKNLNCLNNLMCKDLGYGDFCCPVKGTNSSVCCDTNPNPPPPPPTEAPPKATPLSGAMGANLVFAIILTSSVLPLILG